MTAAARLDLRMSVKEKNTIAHAVQVRGVAVDRSLAEPALAARLRGRVTARLSTDEIMQLTRGA